MRTFPVFLYRLTTAQLTWMLLLLPLSVQARQTTLPGNGSSAFAALSGIIREAGSGEAAIGVNVILVRDTANFTAHLSVRSIVRGTRTNKFGFYTLTELPKGAYFLVVRGIGYKTRIEAVALTDTAQTVNLRLEAQSARSQQITVTAQRGLREIAQTVSRVEVRSDFIKLLPAFGGEKDVFRALQLLPGIQTASELSSGLYVRGGSTDQNLTLLDGAIVYNPSHLGGFFSTFNADALQDIRVLKGGFPAEYGGRLSSVIDLTMKEGSAKKIAGTLALSTLTGAFTAEGPIVSSNATFMLSGRRMIYDWLTKLATSGNESLSGTLPTYYFYDLNAKINYTLSDNDRLFLSGYLGRDVLDFAVGNILELGLGWGNATGNLRWMHVVSPSLFTNFSLIYTNYDYSTSIATALGRQRLEFSTLSRIQDWTARGEAEWLPNSQHSIKAGFEGTQHAFRTYVGTRLIDTSASRTSPQESTDGGSINSIEAALYAQDAWQVNDQLALNLGLRASWFQAGRQINVEPRIAASFGLDNALALKASFSLVNQYMHLLTRNDISLPSDTWIPATGTVVPSNAFQYTFGAEAPLFDGLFNISLEGYYKTMNNLYEYRDGTAANSVTTENIAQNLTRGRGESYGEELLLEKRIGEITGWLGYTLSWANRTFAELNGGKPFSPRYDKRHNISLALTYKLNARWEFGVTWTFTSGQPITLPAAQADFRDVDGANLGAPPSVTSSIAGSGFQPIYHFTERNGSRLPDYHRMDIGATMHTKFFGSDCDYMVSIYNVYNRLNPFTWIISANPNGGLFGGMTSTATVGAANKPVVQQLTLFPFLPTVGMTIKL